MPEPDRGKPPPEAVAYAKKWYKLMGGEVEEIEESETVDDVPTHTEPVRSVKPVQNRKVSKAKISNEIIELEFPYYEVQESPLGFMFLIPEDSFGFTPKDVMDFELLLPNQVEQKVTYYFPPVFFETLGTKLFLLMRQSDN